MKKKDLTDQLLKKFANGERILRESSPSYDAIVWRAVERERKGTIGDISHCHTAFEAGVGTIGKSRLLLTEWFGPLLFCMSECLPGQEKGVKGR